jgi:adenosylmethionine-8-amino-7-oxononanoate aminotransferase
MSLRDELIALDREAVWRPYTSSEDHERVDPLVIASAEGPYLIDTDGRRYLDGSGSWWCNNLGHGHPRLRAALSRQAERLMHCTFAGVTHEPAARLANELLEVAPEGLARVFYSDDGSTSVEVALKMAFQYWQQNGRPERTRFLVLPGAYHGDTFGSMSVSAVDAFSGIFRPLLFETERVGAEQGARAPRPAEAAAPASDDDASFEAVAEAVERRLAEDGDRIAALVVEPLIQGAAGMRTYPPAILRRFREATARADTFLVCDEVFTGFGRTGTFWASSQAGITPDLLCTAKGLTGGMLPFAATLATARVYDGFRGDKRRALMHGHTFCGNPLGAALAREVLAVLREERVLEGIPARAARIAASFDALGAIPGVRRTRALGMVAAADLEGEEGYFGALGWAVHDEAKKRGAHLRPLGNTIYIVPPLNIPEVDLEALLGIVHESVRAALAR